MLKPNDQLWHLAEPFWRSNSVFGESLFFIREAPGLLPTARLLFPPSGPLELTRSSGEIRYSSPEDFILDAEKGVLTLPEGSQIAFMDRAALYPPIGQDHCMAHKKGDDQVGLYFGEEHLFHDLQVQASYAHSSPWQGFMPRPQPERLPVTFKKLSSSAPLKICIIGDSISSGCNASALTGVAPGMPPYPELLADGTEVLTRKSCCHSSHGSW